LKRKVFGGVIQFKHSRLKATVNMVAFFQELDTLVSVKGTIIFVLAWSGVFMHACWTICLIGNTKYIQRFTWTLRLYSVDLLLLA